MSDDGPTILIAEDEALLRDLTRQILELHHYKVLAAGDGHDAVKILAAQKPVHLLLTDLNLPGLGGRELREKAIALHPAIKVIFMSGELTGDDGLPELAHTVYLPKPASAPQLLAKIRALLTE